MALCKINKRTLLELLIFCAILFATFLLLSKRIFTLLNNKALSYYQEGNVDAAIALFKLSLKIAKTAEGYYNLASVYKRSEMLDEAVIEYKKALEINPNYIDATYELVDAYGGQKKYKEAIALLDKMKRSGYIGEEEEWKKLHSYYIECLFNEAVDHHKSGDTAAALSMLKEIIACEPSFASAHRAIGDIYFSQNQLEEAAVYYKQAVVSGMNGARIYNDLGLVYMKLENYEQAAGYLRKAHELEPDNINIFYSLASTLRDGGHIDEALKLYMQIVTIKPDHPNLHNDLGMIYELKGEKEEAEREFKKEIQIINTRFSDVTLDLFVRNRLAIAYTGLEDYEKAKMIINGIITDSPAYGDAYYTRARLYEKLGENEKAEADLKKAKQLLLTTPFVDTQIGQLNKEIIVSEGKQPDSVEDTIIYLKNGRRLRGRLKEDKGENIILEMMAGNAKGTVSVRKELIQLINKIK